MDDFFRPIDGYPGYRISGDGQVLSCWSRHARPARMTGDWRHLKPVHRGGYLTVNLAKGGKKRAFRIHRLVLEAFVGPCPPGLVCCHSNGCPSENRIENLRWDTPQANSDDTLRHGRRARGSKCRSKLHEGDVFEIRRLRAVGLSMGDLAARFQVTSENIWAIVSGRSWRHLPLITDQKVVSQETAHSSEGGEVAT